MPIIYPMIALSMVGLMLPWLPLVFIISEDKTKEEIKPIVSKSKLRIVK